MSRTHLRRDTTEAGPPQLRAMHLCTRYLRGGSERRLADIVDATPEVEHHIILGADSDLGLARRELPTVQVHREPSLVRHLDPRRDLTATLRVVLALRRGSFDVLYTHQSKAGAIGRFAARFAPGVPVIHSLSMANFGPGYGRVEDLLFRMIERTLVGSTAAYAVVGSDLARRYEENGVPRHKLHVVRSGARLPATDRTAEDARRALRRRFDLPPGRPVIVHLGSLEERKRVLSLPDYLARVSACSPKPPILLVAGEGPLSAELEARFRTRGQWEAVRMVGFVRPVDDLLLGADVVVLLSRAEGLPQVLVQAAAANTPFVSYHVDGVDELLGLGAPGSVVGQGALDLAALVTVSYTDGQQRPNARVPRGALDDWSAAAIERAHRDLLQGVVGPLTHRRRAMSETVPTVETARSASPRRRSSTASSTELA